MYRFRLKFVLFIAIFPISFHLCCSFNSTESLSCDEAHHDREKRYLNFPVGGGVAKIIFGAVAPVFFNHKLKRSLNAAVNVQANYRIPVDIIWPVAEDFFRERLNNDYVDNSRPQLYRVLERLISNWGQHGRTCLLRTICEVAEAPLSHNGMFGEILDVMFTPSEMDGVDREYKKARHFGMKGGNCSKRYQACPNGHGLLDAITAKDFFKL